MDPFLKEVPIHSNQRSALPWTRIPRIAAEDMICEAAAIETFSRWQKHNNQKKNKVHVAKPLNSFHIITKRSLCWHRRKSHRFKHTHTHTQAPTQRVSRRAIKVHQLTHYTFAFIFHRPPKPDHEEWLLLVIVSTGCGVRSMELLLLQ